MILDKRDNLKTLYSIGATIKEIKQVLILNSPTQVAGIIHPLMLQAHKQLAENNYQPMFTQVNTPTIQEWILNLDTHSIARLKNFHKHFL